MTTLLYLTNSYLTEFTATVTDVNKDETGNPVFIVLDQTAFYPTGGGQLHDTGTLTNSKDEKTYTVFFTGNLNGTVSHQVDNPGLQPGDVVQGKIDWQRRYQLQKMHTACHVLSSVFIKEAGALITGNQLNTNQSRIDFSLETFDREKIQEYINKANKLLATNQEVEVFFMPRSEAEKKPELAKLAIGLKEVINDIRVVKIGTIDTQADGGTHVKNTKEVGKIVLIKCDNKGKSNRRLYFLIN